MAKKKSSHRLTGKVSDNEIKKKIIRVDKELVKLLNEKARLTIKLNQSPDIAQSPLVEIDNCLPSTNDVKGPLTPESLSAIFTEINSATTSLLHKTRVAFLGPAFSYSELAAIERFGSSHELIPVYTIESVFDEVLRHHCELGVVPLENSTDGRISDTLEMFARMPVHICGEILLKVEHCLLAKYPRNEIHEVYSKSQAISQCRTWLNRHLPHARLVDVASTTSASKIAAEKPGASAIASRAAGAHYGLDIVDFGIQDSKNNVTRFVIIGGQPPQRTGNDKTALILVIPHDIGLLADTMAIFKKQNLNLSWIESYPTPGTEKDFMFFIELHGHQTDPQVKKALDSVSRKAIRLEILGSFPRATLMTE
jgi:chorismate mutase / prephenate dehydratase